MMTLDDIRNRYEIDELWISWSRGFFYCDNFADGKNLIAVSHENVEGINTVNVHVNNINKITLILLNFMLF